MAHAIWNGSINFGLVSIPVKLFPAIRSSEGIHFHLLHDKDEGRIHNVRKCEECGQGFRGSTSTRAGSTRKDRMW